jgi:hypothetical protein
MFDFVEVFQFRIIRITERGGHILDHDLKIYLDISLSFPSSVLIPQLNLAPTPPILL